MRYVLAIATAAAVLFGGITVPTVYAGADKAAHEMEKVSLDQVPAPVRATLEKEAKGGTIGDVTKETKKGKMYYEGQIRRTDGKDRYVHVAPDGKVLKRESARKEAKERAKEPAASVK
jgi:uncharacterized membrane protein YkoI